MLNKYHAIVDRLVYKMNISQTPIPGLITGLSGTDSVLAFLIGYEALSHYGLSSRLLGINYVDHHKRTGWFEGNVIPWLKERCPDSNIRVEVPLGGNQDQQRWADLHLRALREVEDGKPGKNLAEGYWVLGSINATEKALGTYSVFADTASIQPIQTLYKGSVLKICQELGVPQGLIDRSRIPDCLCGRDELAAKNIEVIDAILTNSVDPDVPSLRTLLEYVRDTKKANGFKTRVPYIV
jgi:hypothetical protein